MMESADKAVREHAVDLLEGGGAHLDFDAVMADLPAKVRGERPSGLDLTPWRLLEHMRLAQWDIVAFSKSADHVSPPWPEGYWPAEDGPKNSAAWNRSVKQFRADLRTMVKLVRDPKMDILAEIPWGDGQTILREALLVADHNAYHLGQMVTLRRLLGVWPG